MITIDQTCANKLIGLFEELSFIIQDEWEDIISNLISQLQSFHCEEITISLVLNYLKREICSQSENPVIKECDTSKMVDEKKQEIISILCTLLIQQENVQNYNSIRR